MNLMSSKLRISTSAILAIVIAVIIPHIAIAEHCVTILSGESGTPSPSLLSKLIPNFQIQNELKLIAQETTTFYGGFAKEVLPTELYLEINSQTDRKRIIELLSQEHSALNITKVNELPGNGLIAFSTLTPPIVAHTLGAETARSLNKGNCFNATLNWFSKNILIGNTSSKEIEILLANKKFFRQIHPENRSFGNVIAIRNKANRLLFHTAIYLNDEMIWNKIGAGYNYPTTYEYTESMLSYYVSQYSEKSLILEFYRRVEGESLDIASSVEKPFDY
jgi:hypothetical protein